MINSDYITGVSEGINIYKKYELSTFSSIHWLKEIEVLPRNTRFFHKDVFHELPKETGIRVKLLSGTIIKIK